MVCCCESKSTYEILGLVMASQVTRKYDAYVEGISVLKSCLIACLVALKASYATERLKVYTRNYKIKGKVYE